MRRSGSSRFVTANGPRKLLPNCISNPSASGNGTGRVEVGSAPGFAGVRDTKNREAGHIAVPAEQWTAFLDDVKAGKFDLS